MVACAVLGKAPGEALEQLGQPGPRQVESFGLKPPGKLVGGQPVLVQAGPKEQVQYGVDQLDLGQLCLVKPTPRLIQNTSPFLGLHARAMDAPHQSTDEGHSAPVHGRKKIAW